jgi:tRNA dimethylallyltransferase
VKNVFFIVGPTAIGKSEIAADVAQELDAEIVSADAFQIYRGLNLLTAKPAAQTFAKVPHHLIGTMSILAEMNAEKFRQLARRGIDEIHLRGKLAIVVGGSGFYIKALTHGLTSLPAIDPKLRAQLNELSLDQLRVKIAEIDPETARNIDMKNRRRLVRAIEICLTSGKPASVQRSEWKSVAGAAESGWPRSVIVATTGIFVFRDREDLYQRINRRVDTMFEKGVIEEVRAAGAMSTTVSQMIGLHEIRELLAGKMSILQCVAAIQQGTRRYAKRQLTWFRRQTNFKPLNLSLLTHTEAVKWISQRLKAFGVAQGND